MAKRYKGFGDDDQSLQGLGLLKSNGCFGLILRLCIRAARFPYVLDSGLDLRLHETPLGFDQRC